MAYVAGTRIHLPFIDVTKELGDKITKKELEDAQQTSEDVAALVEGGALLTEELYAALVEEKEKEAAKAQADSLRAQAAALEEGAK